MLDREAGPASRATVRVAAASHGKRQGVRRPYAHHASNRAIYASGGNGEFMRSRCSHPAKRTVPAAGCYLRILVEAERGP